MMIRENKGYMAGTSLITLIPLVVGVLLWDKLPDTIATHFGSDGTANGWSSKAFAVFGLPLIVLAGHWICAVATAYDPKYNHISGKLYRLVLLVCPVTSLICGVVIYAYALELDVNAGLIAELFMGTLLVVIGNYLPKCRQNYTVGIKLPWTLHDEENWNRTHRLAGWLWTICGLLVLVNGFLKADSGAFMGILVAVMVLVPTGYSFVYHLRHKGEAKR